MKNKKLIAAIESDGRTHQQLSDAAQIDRVTLSLILNGHRAARVDTALKLARTLNKPLAEIGFSKQAKMLAGSEVPHDA
jgi:DNA-binding XRE family transcriptional regulator